jgi:uncharacterized cupredoxin-like copper-binding protein
MELVATWEEQRAIKRAKLSPLSRLAKNAAIYITLFFVIIQLVLSGFAPLLSLYGLGALIGYLFARTGWRWGPLPIALWGSTLLWILSEELIFDLTHPAENQALFIFSSILLIGIFIAIPSGIAATIENYLRAPAERRAWRWAPLGLGVVIGMAVGASSVAATLENRVDLTAGVSPDTLAQLPSVGAGATRFLEEELRVKAGQLVALRLENADVGVHSFDVDIFNVHAPMPVGQDGLAMFTPTDPGTYEFYCAIPGHRDFGMVGTLIVEP